MPEFVLVICAPADSGEKLLDLLMEVSDRPFEIGPMFTHGAAHGRMQAAELVSGRTAAVQAQVLVTSAQLVDLISRFRADMRGAGIRYWATPLEVQGEIE